MIDEKKGELVELTEAEVAARYKKMAKAPLPQPIGDYNKGEKYPPKPRRGPILFVGEDIVVTDLPVKEGAEVAPIWAGKIAGLGKKEVCLQRAEPLAVRLPKGELVLLKGHPFQVHGKSEDGCRLVLRCLPKDVQRQFENTPLEQRLQFLQDLYTKNAVPADEQTKVRDFLADLEKAAAETAAVGEAKALLDQALGGSDPGGGVQEELARRILHPENVPQFHNNSPSLVETPAFPAGTQVIGMDLGTRPDIAVVYVQHECGGTLEIPLSALEEVASGTWGTIPCPKCKARLNDLIIAEWDKHEKARKETPHEQ